MSEIKSIDVINYLKQKDIDIVGFASIEHDLHSGEFSSLDLLEDAKSIICFATPIPKGILYSKSNDTLLFWRYSSMIYRKLDTIATDLSLLLEENNYVSTPIYGCFPWKIVKREFKGLLSLVYWAERAGLGLLTKCGLLANPKYGTRFLIGGIITSKQFENTKKTQHELCPEGCVKCVDICPVKAIDQTGKVNHDLCMRSANKNPLMTLLLKDIELRETVDFETIINTVGVEDNASYGCIKCLKACPLNKK